MSHQFLVPCPHCKGIISLSTPDKALKSINNIINKLNQVESAVDIVINKTCDLTGVKRSDILSPDRSKTTSFARHIAMYILRTQNKLSFPEIGKIFNQFEHTSAMYGFVRIKRLLEEKDKDVYNIIEAINNKEDISEEKEDQELLNRIKEIEEQLKTGS